MMKLLRFDLALVCLLAACSHDGKTSTDLAAPGDGFVEGDAATSPVDGATPLDLAGSGAAKIKKVFVITLENQGTAAVYANSDASYLNMLMTNGGHATMYGDVLGAAVPSEPHYVWMEAGTNVFSDYTFTADGDPSPTNSTSSTAHLVTQMAALPTPKTWRAYQEGLDNNTGTCPIKSSGQYAAKHDPFVFFQDVAGNPPSKTNADCTAHHRAYTVSGLQGDLAINDVADYTFITPDLCNDMHGGICSNGCLGAITLSQCVSAADAWLGQIVPSLLTYINAHDGVLMIVWDEPLTTGNQPFVIVGPHVKVNYTGTAAVSHSSYLKSLQEIMGVPVFANVAAANDFSEYFEAGFFP